MAIPYTYWQDADGWFVGYWSDYPDHSTQGRTLDELKYLLISLRKDICEMIADGTWTDAPRQPQRRWGEGSSRRGAERQRAQRILFHAKSAKYAKFVRGKNGMQKKLKKIKSAIDTIAKNSV